MAPQELLALLQIFVEKVGSLPIPKVPLAFLAYYVPVVSMCLISFYKHLKRAEKKRAKSRAKDNKKLAVPAPPTLTRRLSVWDRLEQTKSTESPSPFVNPDWYWSKREYFKYCFLGPVLVPVRLVLVITFISCGSLFGNLCLMGLR